MTIDFEGEGFKPSPYINIAKFKRRMGIESLISKE
jgi:hypothetical protein